MRSFHVFLIPCVLIAAACKEPPPAPMPPPEAPPVEAPAIAPANTPTPTALPPSVSPTASAAPIAIQAIIADGAKFQFSLKESPDALKLQQLGCAQGDAVKQAVCLEAVTKEGTTEGIRFEKEGDKLLWVSFGVGKGGKEEIYLRGPIALLDAPADELHFRPAGAFTGIQATQAGFDKFPPDRFITVKAIDAKTIVMQAPPPKGALMYHRQ